MEVIVLCIVLAAKFVQDWTFAKQALDEVKQLRKTVEGRLEDHDKRISNLEDK